MVVCLERGADLRVAQLMPLPLTVSCFSKIQTGFTSLVPAYLGSSGKWPLHVCGGVIVDQRRLGKAHCTDTRTFVCTKYAVRTYV